MEHAILQEHIDKNRLCPMCIIRSYRTNAFGHAPGGWIRHLQFALQTFCRYAFRCLSHQKNPVKPLGQWHRRTFEDGMFHRINMRASAVAGIAGFCRVLVIRIHPPAFRTGDVVEFGTKKIVQTLLAQPKASVKFLNRQIHVPSFSLLFYKVSNKYNNYLFRHIFAIRNAGVYLSETVN